MEIWQIILLLFYISLDVIATVIFSVEDEYKTPALPWEIKKYTKN